MPVFTVARVIKGAHTHNAMFSNEHARDVPEVRDLAKVFYGEFDETPGAWRVRLPPRNGLPTPLLSWQPAGETAGVATLSFPDSETPREPDVLMALVSDPNADDAETAARLVREILESQSRPWARAAAAAVTAPPAPRLVCIHSETPTDDHPAIKVLAALGLVFFGRVQLRLLRSLDPPLGDRGIPERSYYYVEVDPAGNRLKKGTPETGGYGMIYPFVALPLPEMRSFTEMAALRFRDSPEQFVHGVRYPNLPPVVLRWHRYGPSTGVLTQVYEGKVAATSLLLSGMDPEEDRRATGRFEQSLAAGGRTASAPNLAGFERRPLVLTVVTRHMRKTKNPTLDASIQAVCDVFFYTVGALSHRP